MFAKLASHWDLVSFRCIVMRTINYIDTHLLLSNEYSVIALGCDEVLRLLMLADEEDEKERSKADNGAAPTSSHFLSYDADDAADRKKRKAAASSSAAAAEPGMDGGDDEDGHGGTPDGKQKKGKGRGRGAVVFVQDDGPSKKGKPGKKDKGDDQGKNKKKR